MRATTRVRRVVVADDAETMRTLLATRLGADGRFEVVAQATDGDDAVDVAIAADADAVLLDVAMPGADGMHALRRLRREAPHIAVVVLSGFRADEFAGQAIELGARAYVEKGVELDELVAILDATCEDPGPARVATVAGAGHVTTHPPTPTPTVVVPAPDGPTGPDSLLGPPSISTWHLWLCYALVLAVATGGLAISQAADRARLEADHVRDTARAATVAASVVEQLWTQMEEAADGLVGPEATGEQLLGLAAALGGDGAILVDADGVVVASARVQSVVGRRLGDTYEHIARLVEGERVASGVVVNPEGMRITSIGVPLPDGRALGVAFDADELLGDSLLAGVPEDVARAWVVDDADGVVATDVGLLAPHERLLPPPTRDAVLDGADTAGWTTTTTAIDGTSWRLVTAAPDARVFADVAASVTALPWFLVALVATAGAVAVSNHGRSRRRLLELRATNRELAAMNGDLEQFAYVASHDLQEPLRKVASYCQLLERRYGDQLDDTALQYIDYAVDGATRMQSLLTDLLRFSRAGRADRTTTDVVDLEDAIGGAVEALSLRIEEADARVVLPEAPPAVRADATQVQQVVQNLVANALKFHRPGEPPVVHVGATTDGHMVRLSVRDAGIGIPPEHHERVFGLFQRLHARDEYPGTGVGLAICRRMVERAGGRLWVTSTPGRGSTFHATFPHAPRSDR